MIWVKLVLVLVSSSWSSFLSLLEPRWQERPPEVWLQSHLEIPGARRVMAGRGNLDGNPGEPAVASGNRSLAADHRHPNLDVSWSTARLRVPEQKDPSPSFGGRVTSPVNCCCETENRCLPMVWWQWAESAIDAAGWHRGPENFLPLATWEAALVRPQRLKQGLGMPLKSRDSGWRAPER
jgi:hypothetical protein